MSIYFAIAILVFTLQNSNIHNTKSKSNGCPYHFRRYKKTMFIYKDCLQIEFIQGQTEPEKQEKRLQSITTTVFNNHI